MKTEAEITSRIHDKLEILKSPRFGWAAYMDEAEVLRAEIDQLSWVLSDAPPMHGSRDDADQSPAKPPDGGAQPNHEKREGVK